MCNNFSFYLHSWPMSSLNSLVPFSSISIFMHFLRIMQFLPLRVANVFNFFISSLWCNYFKFLHHLSPHYADKIMETEHILILPLSQNLFTPQIYPLWSWFKCGPVLFNRSTKYWNYYLQTTIDFLIIYHTLLLFFWFLDRSTTIFHLFFPDHQRHI